MQSKENLSLFPLGTRMNNYNFNLSLVTFTFTYNKASDWLSETSWIQHVNNYQSMSLKANVWLIWNADCCALH